MNKKTKGLLAGAAGAALLLGGGTFALWSDSDTVDGGTITSGNLEVEFLSEGIEWRDISDDRSGGRHDIINLDDFRIIPGDTLQAAVDIDAALQGENIVANLLLDVPDAEGALFAGLDPEQVTTVLYYGNRVILDRSGWGGDPIEVQFASEDNGDSGDLYELPAELDGDRDLRVLVTFSFDEDTSDRDLVQTQAALGDLVVSLEQTREDAYGYN